MDKQEPQDFNEALMDALAVDRWRIDREALELADAGREPDAATRARWSQALEKSRRIVASRRRLRPHPAYPDSLPVAARREDIVEAIRNHPVVIVAGETGSGKTTQLPKMCLDAGCGVRGLIVCAQPRRVAAQSISKRIAEELEVTWGREVGCKVRFSDDMDRRGYIKLMTDGILLAEAQGDPWLTAYDTLIIDEAHERSLNIDFILGYLVLLLERRSDLKVIITSATIDTERFSRAFGGAPIIEVSGRTFPVEVVYSPITEEDEEDGVTYIEAASNAVETLIDDPISGDVLVFMPGERDIRECRDQLEGRRLPGVEVVPLFGRLSAAEQQRVFQPSSLRRVVIATNVAETSLTIPNIRYVVDPGLARISRYSARSRTKRLPIEAISQSSANQRKGRCGRVADGVCVRLYSEEDFEERAEFTQPEIQRANLAEVILRMEAFHLGKIESFPFIDPPNEASIKAGYRMLQDLGAMDAARELTDIGHELARLPIDPTIGRMLLQAREEGALTEVLAVAAALSVQDPRERPMDAEGAADAAHQPFLDSDSDFVTLLNFWRELESAWQRHKTQSQMRKYCRRQFLNYNRVREWRDLHSQIRSALKDVGRFTLNETPASYEAIHRSIATGLITQVAERQERNWYRGVTGRRSMVFPASALFDRGGKTRRRGGPSKEEESSEKSSQPRWIVAGEFVETSQLFARTVAKVDPLWILEIGAHLVKRQYYDPRWDRKTGRALITEKALLGHLELLRRAVDFGRVAPDEATDLFIRQALIEGDMDHRYEFLEHNRTVIERLRVWRRWSRDPSLAALDEAVYDFYASRLPHVSSVHDLNRLIKKKGGDASFMTASEATLYPDIDVAGWAASFPEAFAVGEHRLEVRYRHDPGAEDDGAVVMIPSALAERFSQGSIDWLIPGLRRPLVEELLRAAPKDVRRQLMPLPERAELIAREMRLMKGDLGASLSAFVHERLGVSVSARSWELDAIAPALRPRVRLVDAKGRRIAEGAALADVFAALKTQRVDHSQKAWSRLASQVERYHLDSWSIGDPPDRIEAPGKAGQASLVFPGLHLDQGQINLRLFRSRDEAARASGPGFRGLAAKALGKDMAWLHRDLRNGLSKSNRLYAHLGTFDALLEAAYEHCQHHLFEAQAYWPLRQANFDAVVAQSRRRLPGLAAEVIRLVEKILELRLELSLRRHGYPGLENEINALAPPDFLRRLPHARLRELPRYLDAKRVRADRYDINPPKDQAKAAQVTPHVQRLAEGARQGLSRHRPRAWAQYRWLLEEFRVSVFAQELGVATPVSSKKLDAAWAEVVGDSD